MPCLFYQHLESIVAVGVGIHLWLNHSFSSKQAFIYVIFHVQDSAFIFLEYPELDYEKFSIEANF
jgi:hypothetical protein